MKDFLYHNGDLVVEQCGNMLVTRERGRYVSAPIQATVASRNFTFEDEVNEWLEPYYEEDRKPHYELERDIIGISEDPFED